MTGHLIQTAADFKPALGSHDYAIWDLTHPDSTHASQVRASVDQLFAELKYLEAGDSEMQALFMDDAAEPLEQLRSSGSAILAVVSRGTIRLPGGREVDNWVRAHYFIVPVHGSFRIGDDLASPVHRFNPNCADAVAALHLAARDGLTVSSWIDDRSVTVDHEGRVPWCTQCLVESMGTR